MREDETYRQERPVVYLIGIGMGGEDQLTGQAIDRLEGAEAVMGAGRMLGSVEPYIQGKPVLTAYKPSEMVQWLGSFSWTEAALVLSGDTGFYSGAEAASKAFIREGWDVEYIPGISSLSYFCARIGRSWQDVYPVSSHGRECDIPAWVRTHKTCFVLLGGEGGLSELCRSLVSSGLGHVDLWAGEKLSYREERILWKRKPAEILMEEEVHPFGSLACAIVENPHAVEARIYPELHPRDSDFIRGKTPMTKESVRRLSLETLRIGADAVCFDIGAGTGSVSVEMGLAIRRQCGEGRVYAIEREPGALELIDANRRKFHGDWSGFHIVAGEAPEALRGLETPTHAFIGGSGGRMKEMIEVLLQMNSKVRIVANAISLETVTEILECMKKYGFKEGEILQIQASAVEQVGSYHMPKAQNPVYIAVMQHPAEDGEELQWQDL